MKQYYAESESELIYLYYKRTSKAEVREALKRELGVKKLPKDLRISVI